MNKRRAAKDPPPVAETIVCEPLVSRLEHRLKVEWLRRVRHRACGANTGEESDCQS